jgi:lipoprotein-anchoring transpeptidase ErfK/SrfK
MKRGLAVSLLFACAAAGVLSAYALAGGRLPAAVTTLVTVTTGTTSTATTTTGTTTGGTTTIYTTTTATTTTVRKPPPPKTLPEGVTVGGVPVGNLLPGQATKQIRKYFSSPLELTLGRRLFRVNPNTLAAPRVTRALTQARKARPFANLPLDVNVRTLKVRAYVAKLAGKIDRTAIDSTLLLRGLKPYVTPDRPAVALNRERAVQAISTLLARNVRITIVLRTKEAPARVNRRNFGPVVVIHRASNQLYLYTGMRLNRLFPVATGQSVYPTPLGAFHVIVKWRNPWWYPPASPWAEGEKPIPPGPDNPLGTRWMGISAPGVGIHGTNNESSIGYSVSHGCIRMHVRDAEWLFNRVDIGTPVFIVAA